MLLVFRYWVIKAVSKVIVWTVWLGLLMGAPKALLALFAFVRPLTNAVGALLMALLPSQIQAVKLVLDAVSGAVTTVARLQGPTAEAIVRSFGIDGAVTGLVAGVSCSVGIAGYLAYRERRAIRKYFRHWRTNPNRFDRVRFGPNDGVSR
mgnify:CR=1 FL=1